MKDFATLDQTIKVRLFMNFLGGMAFASVGSSMTIYYNEYLGAGITGILLIASSLVVFSVGLWAGHLSDLYGRRPIMLYSTAITTVGGVIAANANSPWLFSPWLTFLGFLVMDFGFGFYNTASSAMIVDLTTPQNRKMVYSIQYWVFNMAIMFGSALSAWLFRDYLFELLIFITLEEFLSFVLVLLMIPETMTHQEESFRPETNILKAYGKVIYDKAFLWYCVGSIFSSLFFTQVDYYLPVHLSDSFQTTTIFGFEIFGQRALTLFLIINTFLIVSLMSLVNRLTSRWLRRTGFIVGSILMGAGMGLAFLGKDLTAIVLASIVLTVGEMVLVPVSQAYRADLMDGEMIGTYSGAYTIVQPIANVIAGLMVSFSVRIGHVGMAISMILVVILVILAISHSINLREKTETGKISS